MATIDAQNSNPSGGVPTSVREVFKQAVNAGKPAPARADETADSSTERAIHDTVTLSDGGQKIVNLNRGQDLGQELKNAPVDEDFAARLKQGTDDVFRITHLFTQTIRAAFSWLR